MVDRERRDGQRKGNLYAISFLDISLVFFFFFLKSGLFSI